MPSKSAVKYAKALREWAGKHPVADIGLGFVPGVGQLYGLAHAAAANIDPDATTLDRGLSTLGVLPLGRAAGAARKVVIGERGANAAEKKLLETARQLLKTKKSTPRQIQEETGWWAGPGGRWRMELPEDGMTVARFSELPKRFGEYHGPIKDAVKGNPALNRYKEFDATDLRYQPPGSGRGGSYSSAKRPKTAWSELQAANSGKSPRSRVDIEGDAPRHDVAAHEIQHGVQDFEGWGSPYTGSSLETVNNNFNLYLLNPGEIEARVAALRRNWTPKERKALPFRDMYDREYARVNKHLQSGATARIEPTNQEYKEMLEGTGLNYVDMLLRNVEF